MKGRDIIALFIIVLCVGVILGATGISNVFDTKLSTETVDSIAREQARAQIMRDNESARNNETIKFLLLAVATMAALLMTAPLSFWLLVRAVSAWHRRHDRAPDFAGRFAIMPATSDRPMFNPQTGLQLGQPVSEATMVQLAGRRAMVDATAAAFHGGIERKQAGDRQRDTRRAEPEGWGGTIAMPEAQAPDVPALPATGLLLVDDTGERRLLTDAQPQKPHLQPQSQEANLWL